MYNLNKVIVAGNLTRDPELKALPGGQNVCSMSIATNEVYIKDGERKETTEYHNIVIFGKQAENSAKYLKKGDQALVEGKNQTRSWEKDGVKLYRTEIIAQSIQFGGKRDATSATTVPAKSESPSVLPNYPEDEINPEDLPF